MQITPAVLSHVAQDAHEKLFHPGLRKVAKRFHIDVLDGTLYGATCFADSTIIGAWENIPEIELHLMVSDPFTHVVNWKQNVETLTRVILHAETPRPLPILLRQMHAMNLATSLAINPDTIIDKKIRVAGFDELVIMGVQPGKSGQAFLGEPILSKIRRAKMLFPNLPLAVDGGVNKNVIHLLAEAGATRFIASNAIWAAEKPEEALDELLRCAIISP